MRLILSSLTLVILVLSGCGSTPVQPAKHAKPEWIKNGKGAIGICDTHINGNAAQEEAAMDRALEKLAKQQEVLVRTTSSSTQKENSGAYSSGYQSFTDIKADVKVKGRIKNSWRDPSNNRYYILMVMD